MENYTLYCDGDFTEMEFEKYGALYSLTIQEYYQMDVSIVDTDISLEDGKMYIIVKTNLLGIKYFVK